MFKRLVESQFDAMVRGGNFMDLRALGLKTTSDMEREASLFRNIIDKSFLLAARSGLTSRQQNPYFWSWRRAFVTGDTSNLQTELKYSFTSFVVRQHLSQEALKVHEGLADFRFPHEWFPATRTMQRTIHLHVGPTNSGKTYHALKALENSKTGIYAGPLRLLAHETYMRFKNKGLRCALMTGEEQRIPEGDESYFASCTVEMTPLNLRVDVAVIDEIQMIGDDQRGWAWTQAVLGVQAKEVHLCGEARAVPLIQAICAKLGDEIVIHNYERLNPLQPMQESLGGSFDNLRKGDAVVSFSRFNLHTLKAGIEQATGKKCAIVYGALPPESRAQQAALFNDPDNDYDFLAASDAIGMGLNLEIRRVVFESITKHDGVNLRTLTIPELKQIGGRAGRYRTAAHAVNSAALTSGTSSSGAPTIIEQNKTQTTEGGPGSKPLVQPGFVTTLEDEDIDTVHMSFDQEAEPLESAGISPPAFVIEKFASYFPAGTPFSFILLRLRDIARLEGHYHMCQLKNNLEIAEITAPFPMTIQDRCVFLNAPISLRDVGMVEVVRALARRIAYNLDGSLLTLREVNLEILDHDVNTYPNGKTNYLRHLEALHKALTLYLWLSYRYPGMFKDQALAFHVKEMAEQQINAHLDSLDYSAEARKQRVEAQRKLVGQRRKQRKRLLGDEEDSSTLPAVESGEMARTWTEEGTSGEEEPLLGGLEEVELPHRADNVA